MIRKVLAWLVRPQYTALAVGSWFLVGTVGAWGFPWWGGLTAAAVIGAAYGVSSVLIPRFLRRKARQS
jgi:hypothetical protein